MRSRFSRRLPSDRTVTPGHPWTLLGPGGLFKGEFILTGDVLIHGRFEGTLFTDGMVWVAPEATVEGGIHGRRVIIEGSCRGRVEAIEWAEVRDGAVVRADVETPALKVADGARMSGNRIASTPDARSPRVETYRSTPPGNA